MRPGEIVAGKYRLDAKLGIGGMGEVWRATHTGLGREFALKFMHAHTAASATARERFNREARASAAINHPSVIDVFDVGEHDDGTLWLAMELLEGISLAEAFCAKTPLTIHELCVIMHDAARALAAAHAVGIIHRDIKPANVFLHNDRATGLAAAKILDFGISKFAGMEDQTATGAVLGSPRYMSPEQTRSAAAVTPLADLWACGVILFEGLTGTWPHEGDSYSSLVVAICTAPPRSIDQLAPTVPEPVRAIVRDCLKPLDERLRSAASLADRLAAALVDPCLAERPLARPSSPSPEAVKTVTGVRIRPLLTTTASHRALAALPPRRLPLPPTLPVPPPGTTGSRTVAMPAHVGAAGDPEVPVRGLGQDGGLWRGPSPSLDGTLETLATTTLREPAPAVRLPAPVAPAPVGGRAAPDGRGLRALLAVVAALFACIVIALVAVLRSGSTAGDGAAATAASALTPPSAAPPASAPPVPSGPATTEPAASPSASAPAALADAKQVEGRRAKAPPTPRPPPPPTTPSRSKVKDLGSGL